VFLQERWDLGSAQAVVLRCGGYVVIELRGVVTAPAYEGLHRRLAMEAGACTLVIGSEVLLAVTNVSAVEAALRGATKAVAEAPVRVLVPAFRLRWAERHCKLMTSYGFARAACALPSPSTSALRTLA
jgi:hypothetical protein